MESPSLKQGAAKRKHGLATVREHHVGEGRVRPTSGKNSRSLANNMATRGASMPATQDPPQQAPDRARTREPFAPA